MQASASRHLVRWPGHLFPVSLTPPCAVATARVCALHTCAGRATARTSAFNSGAIQLSISPATPVEDAVTAACVLLGRSAGLAEQQLIERLQANWLDTAGDIAAMPSEQALALQLPMRIKTLITAALQRPAFGEGEADSAGAIDSDSTTTEASTSFDAVSDGAGSDDSVSEAQAAAAEAASALLAPPEEGLEALHPDIAQRRASPWQGRGRPPKLRPQVTSRTRQAPYSLRPQQLTPGLARELEDFKRFCTKDFFGKQEPPMRLSTYTNRETAVLGALGWLHNVRGVPLDKLSLRSLIPTPEERSAVLPYDFVRWLVDERGVNERSQYVALYGMLTLAKFLFHSESKSFLKQTTSGAKAGRAYADIPVVAALQRMEKAAFKATETAPAAAEEGLKWLTWPEYLACMRQLRRECAGLTSQGVQRSGLAVAQSLQRYLIFAILSCVPDRQRTLRELQLGRTLVKKDGSWLIRHRPEDYKTGGKYGERAQLLIAPFVYPELEAFVDTWRAHQRPQHDFLFSDTKGQPLTAAALSRQFTLAAHRITGRRPSPHMVRDMIVTHVRGDRSITGSQLEALSVLMGHSIAEQRATYDRRTAAQRVEPAVDLISGLLAAGGGSGTSSKNV